MDVFSGICLLFVCGFVTSSIVHSTKHQYLSYLEGNFEVFQSIGCNDKGTGPPNRKFYYTLEYKCPIAIYPLHDFHKICKICCLFQDAEGLQSYDNFKLRGLGLPKFSGPASNKTTCQTPRSFGGARTCEVLLSSYHHAEFGEPQNSALLQRPKTLLFLVCVFVCVYAMLLNDIDCAHNFAVK